MKTIKGNLEPNTVYINNHKISTFEDFIKVADENTVQKNKISKLKDKVNNLVDELTDMIRDLEE